MSSAKQYLIEESLHQFPKTLLPNCKHVLGRLVHLHFVDHKTIAESINCVVEELVSIWNKFDILTKKKSRVKISVEKLFSEYNKLRKKRFDENIEKKNRRESAFKQIFSQFFDIAHADALNKMENVAAKQFLECHQNDLSNNGRLKNLSKQIRLNASAVPSIIPNLRPIKHTKLDELTFPALVPDTIFTTMEIPDNTSTSSITDSDYEPPQRRPKIAMKKEIVSLEVASTIDRCATSNVGAMMLLSSTLNAAGLDIQNVNLSASTIARRRRSARIQAAQDIKNKLDTGNTLVTVHYDEKKMKDFTGGIDRRNAVVNRIAVVISFRNQFKVLSIPKIQNGTGKTIATSVRDILKEWNLTNKVRALSFDTTSSNTGPKKGSAFILEKLLNTSFLFLACRHHIAEVLLKLVFQLTLEPESNAPNIILFQKFQIVWPQLKVDYDTIQANSAVNDCVIKQHFPHNIRDKLVQFAYKQLETHHARDDYADFAHSVLLFLGETPLSLKGSIRKIKVPGSVSRARFMAHGTYALKIYLFRDQFELKDKELENLREMNVFTVIVYMTYWFQCTIPFSAPKLDLLLISNLFEFRHINERIANKVLTKFGNHLWYLSETLIGFAFFDRSIDVKTKRLMVTALQKAGKIENAKKASINFNSVDVFNLRIDSFVTSNTKQFFNSLFLNDSTNDDCLSFLKIDPSCWIQNEKYLRAEEVVKNISVVNDAAERAINLMSRHNDKVTSLEAEKQALLHVVEDHCKLFPYGTTKANISERMQQNKIHSQ